MNERKVNSELLHKFVDFMMKADEIVDRLGSPSGWERQIAAGNLDDAVNDTLFNIRNALPEWNYALNAFLGHRLDVPAGNGGEEYEEARALVRRFLEENDG